MSNPLVISNPYRSSSSCSDTLTLLLLLLTVLLLPLLLLLLLLLRVPLLLLLLLLLVLLILSTYPHKYIICKSPSLLNTSVIARLISFTRFLNSSILFFNGNNSSTCVRNTSAPNDSSRKLFNAESTCGEMVRILLNNLVHATFNAA